MSALGGADGTLRLQSDDSGFLALTAAEPGPQEGIVKTRLDVDAPAGGTVEVVFSTPRTIATGAERQVVRWNATNRSASPVAAWASYAIERLPTRCDFEVFHRWETVGPDLKMNGRAELYPQHNLGPGEHGGATQLEFVPDGCRGDFVLVLLATADPIGGDVFERRVPISIR